MRIGTPGTPAEGEGCASPDGINPAPDSVTGLLGRLRQGESEALDQLLPALYDQLRDLARYHLGNERIGHTLGATALVHEAYVRLAQRERLEPLDRVQFFSIAGRTMRRVLVDHARSRQRLKRGGGQVPCSFDEVESFLTYEVAEELIVLDDAIGRLATVDERSARVVEMRFFGGFSLEETATQLGTSTKTIQRDWIAARAWLRKEVKADLGMPETFDPGDREVVRP